MDTEVVMNIKRSKTSLPYRLRWIRTLFVFVVFSGTAMSQNFSKVIEIVGGMEESLKTMITAEEQNRKREIAALRSDLTNLKTALFSGDTIRRQESEVASSAALSVMDRLKMLEQTVGESAPSPEMEILAGHLVQLVDELKKVIEEEKEFRKQPAPSPLYTIGGQIRHRGELDGRSFVPEARTLGYNLLRSRFNVSIAPAQDVAMYVQVQDSRLFGSGNPSLNRGVQDGMSKSIEFHQAYFSLQKMFDTPLNVKIGRQEISYGKQRLVCASGWSNVGNAFDAATAQYGAGPVTIDAFFAKLVGSQVTTNSENIGGVYGLARYADSHTADGFLFFDNNTAPIPKGPDKGKPKLGRYSGGVTLVGKPQPFDYEAEMILQRGSLAVNDSAVLADVDAYLLAFNAGYTVSKAHKVRIGLKYQAMSGDRDQQSGSYTTYNTLFSSAHSFFGYMDYFPKTMTEYGIRSLSIHSSALLSPLTSVAVDAYYYRLDVEGTLKKKSGVYEKTRDVGFETDVTVVHKYSDAVSINAGVSAFIPGTAMRIIKGSAASYWSYIMTTVNF